jgi:hypothetical protein
VAETTAMHVHNCPEKVARILAFKKIAIYCRKLSKNGKNSDQNM